MKKTKKVNTSRYYLKSIEGFLHDSPPSIYARAHKFVKLLVQEEILLVIQAEDELLIKNETVFKFSNNLLKDKSSKELYDCVFLYSCKLINKKNNESYDANLNDTLNILISTVLERMLNKK